MLEINPQKLDWRLLLQDLKDKGISRYKIAKILGRSESTVNSWWKGHEPSHSNGEAIIDLHIREFGLETTDKKLDAMKFPIPMLVNS